MNLAKKYIPLDFVIAILAAIGLSTCERADTSSLRLEELIHGAVANLVLSDIYKKEVLSAILWRTVRNCFED